MFQYFQKFLDSYNQDGYKYNKINENNHILIRFNLDDVTFDDVNKGLSNVTIKSINGSKYHSQDSQIIKRFFSNNFLSYHHYKIYNNVKLSLSYFSFQNNIWIYVLKRLDDPIVVDIDKVINICNIFITLGYISHVQIFILPYKYNKIAYKNVRYFSKFNVNSGMSSHMSNEIHLYRNEEFYKVLIHELLHLSKFDISGCKENGIVNPSGIINVVRPSEGYIETIATILNLVLMSKNIDISNLLNVELNFSLTQSYKVYTLLSMGYEDYSNIYQYIIYKSYMLMNINNFMKFVQKYEKIDTDEKYELYIKLFVKDHKDIIKYFNDIGDQIDSLRFTFFSIDMS